MSEATGSSAACHGRGDELIEALVAGAWNASDYGPYPYLGAGELFTVTVFAPETSVEGVRSIVRGRLGDRALRKVAPGLPVAVAESLPYRHARSLYRALRDAGAAMTVDVSVEGDALGSKNAKMGRRTLRLRGL